MATPMPLKINRNLQKLRRLQLETPPDLTRNLDAAPSLQRRLELHSSSQRQSCFTLCNFEVAAYGVSCVTIRLKQNALEIQYTILFVFVYQL